MRLRPEVLVQPLLWSPIPGTRECPPFALSERGVCMHQMGTVKEVT